MIYLRDKAKKVNEMSAGIVAFVLVLEEKLRDQINQELLDEENREGVIGEDHQELLSGIRRDARRIAEDIRVHAFDHARKMVIEGIQDEEKPKSKRKQITP
jgi:hypothetical protein